MKKNIDDRIKIIDLEIKSLQKIIKKKDEKWDYSRPFNEYSNHIEKESKAISKLDREKRMIMPYELSELSEYGDVMSIEDFIDTVKSGGFIDYDGFGYYVKDDKETNIVIIPSDVKHNSIRKEFNEVIWFNR